MHFLKLTNKLFAMTGFTLFFIAGTKTDSLKYLVLNYFRVPQVLLNNTFHNFYRKRDYYRVPNRAFTPFGPNYLTFKALSEAVNSTVITEVYAQSANISMVGCAQIYPVVWTYTGAPYSLEILMKIYFLSKNVSNAVTVIPIPIINFNFVYCDLPKLKTEMPWNMKTLAEAFDTSVWLSILVSIVAVTITLKLVVEDTSFVETGYIALDALFPDNVDAPRKFQRVPLLYLWLLICFILSNYYSGIITSAVISPSQENSYSYLTELVTQNFTILFDSKVTFGVINATARFQLNTTQNADELALNQVLDVASKYRILKNDVYSEQESPTKLLIKQRKLVLVYLWQFVIDHLNKVNSLFANVSPRKRPVHCYIGKRLIPAGSVYQVYVAPIGDGGDKLGRIARYIMESGIYFYWLDEYIQLLHSSRVQERSRVKSMTKFSYDFEEATIAPLELEGKISSIFFLWFVCLICLCCSIFLIELKCYKRNGVTVIC